jgi:hypothetical protein
MLHRVGGHATHSSNLVAPCTEMENDDTGRFLWIEPEKSREAFRGVRRSNTLCGKPSAPALQGARKADGQSRGRR